MFIKAIVIEGVEEDIKITRTDAGAQVTVQRYTRGRGAHDKVIAEFGRDEPRETRFARACGVAKAILGTDAKGRVNATNSMLHDVMNEIDRVAGC